MFAFFFLRSDCIPSDTLKKLKSDYVVIELIVRIGRYV